MKGERTDSIAVRNQKAGVVELGLGSMAGFRDMCPLLSYRIPGSLSNGQDAECPIQSKFMSEGCPKEASINQRNKERRFVTYPWAESFLPELHVGALTRNSIQICFGSKLIYARLGYLQ